MCTARGETPVGCGALDETFDLAYEIEQTTAAGVPQAGIFLDCYRSKVDTYPLYALYACLNMYSGRHRVLIQGAISASVMASHGVLVAKGLNFASTLRQGYRQVHKSLTQANMLQNKNVVICDGVKAKRRLLMNSGLAPLGCLEVRSAAQTSHDLS
eukprot:4565594-Amphidinium_carterae.2